MFCIYIIEFVSTKDYSNLHSHQQFIRNVELTTPLSAIATNIFCLVVM